ncbi:MAG: hypothetical protein H0U16_07030 [Actinobacteria bacterium]|nr:hypothetical protein [Actinomycetota bacterium]
MSDREEDEERARPRVVDKRVSARRPVQEPPEPTSGSPAGTPPVAPATPGTTSEDGTPQGSGAIPAPPVSDAPSPAEPSSPPPSAPSSSPQTAPGGPADDPLWTPEAEAEAQRVAQEIAETPSRDLLLNIAGNLINLAAIKVDLGDPLDARLLIDALAALSKELGPSLGSADAPLRQTVAQLQMAYTQKVGGPAPPGA